MVNRYVSIHPSIHPSIYAMLCCGEVRRSERLRNVFMSAARGWAGHGGYRSDLAGLHSVFCVLLGFYTDWKGLDRIGLDRMDWN